MLDKIIFKLIWKEKCFKNTYGKLRKQKKGIIAPNLTIIKNVSPWRWYLSHQYFSFISHNAYYHAGLLKEKQQETFPFLNFSGFSCFST